MVILEGILYALVFVYFSLVSGLIKNDETRKHTELLHVKANDIEPYFYKNSDGIFSKGIEYELMKTLEEKLQVEILFHSWRELNSFRGNDSELNQTDIWIGGLFPDLSDTKQLQLSVSYLQDQLTWCIQKSKNYPLIYQCMLILDKYVWCYLVFIYGYVCSIIVYILISLDEYYNLKNHCDFHYTVWQVTLTAFFGLGPKFRPVYGMLRIFYGMMLIIGFICSMMIGAYLHTFLTYPQQRHQIKTIDEMIENNFRLVGTQKVLEMIKFDSRYTTQQLNSFYECKNLRECLNHLKRDENYDMAVGGSRNHMMNNDDFDPSKVLCFDRLENVATFPISLWMRKNVLNEKKAAIDDIINRIFESGLPTKWFSDYKHKTDSRVSHQLPNRLRVDQLAFAMCFLYLPFICGSCLTLCLEKITFQYQNKPKSHWIWKYMEQFCDGQRHYLLNLLCRWQENQKNSKPSINLK